MKTLYRLSIIYIGLALTSCASMIDRPTPPNKPSAVAPLPPMAEQSKKNPLKVAFYTKGHPKSAYTVVGEESISKFNLGGNKRQEANIRDGMRELAAAMGGDAVINIKHDAKEITGTVVAYQNNTTQKSLRESS